MDEDEIRVFAEGRPAVPPFRPEARERARELLLAEARRGGRFRLPRFGWQAAAAFGVTVALVGGVAVTLSNQGAGTAGPATSVTQSAALWDELNPRPGQYILIESDTMFPSYAVVKKGEESRWLYRTHRKIWKSVDGSKDGLLMIEGREPKPWPGRELPELAKEEKRGSGWSPLPSCSGGPNRLDYAYMSTLPTDPAAMREHVYKASDPSEGKDVGKDTAAFTYVTDLVRETYLPKAQREALFEAAKSIPGVEVAEGVADSAGRKGVALGVMNKEGTLRQAIFDPATHMYLGERQSVVEDKGVGAPAGSVLALTAQLAVSVVDQLPDAPLDDTTDTACAAPEPTQSAAPTGEPSPTTSPADERRPTTPPTDKRWPATSQSATPTPEEPLATITITETPAATITRTVTPQPAKEPVSSEERTEAPPRPTGK